MTAMTETLSPPSRTRYTITWILVAVALLISFLVAAGLVWISSGVSGREFAPSHFHTRNFEVAQIPWLGFQIGGLQHSSSNDSTSQYLIAQKLIRVPTTPPVRWDLVEIHHNIGLPQEADTSVLTAYLTGQGSHGVDWEKWSKDHPAAAAVFWPFVQQLAIDQLYLMLPDAFDLARQQTNPVELQQALDDYFVAEFPAFAADLAHAGRSAEAIAALESAIGRYPQQASFSAALDELQSPN
ncbi:hypothetical protein Poly24_55710 [Rosistilla carotiformis]|uniref:Uncharacterized protein n=1 Tax=Rosistilla carotiformis TaxID=2528017 RepID=A0A518K1Z7_9BACT|nr:hypothetical protein [Rosistilla carotiformis]QDV71831.1 hypothetical protein Poly24_55710 [Rosistilla carotiformis]